MSSADARRKYPPGWDSTAPASSRRESELSTSDTERPSATSSSGIMGTSGIIRLYTLILISSRRSTSILFSLSTGKFDFPFGAGDFSDTFPAVFLIEVAGTSSSFSGKLFFISSAARPSFTAASAFFLSRLFGGGAFLVVSVLLKLPLLPPYAETP